VPRRATRGGTTARPAGGADRPAAGWFVIRHGPGAPRALAGGARAPRGGARAPAGVLPHDRSRLRRAVRDLAAARGGRPAGRGGARARDRLLLVGERAVRRGAGGARRPRVPGRPALDAAPPRAARARAVVAGARREVAHSPAGA